MSKEKKDRKYESASQDFFDLELIPSNKRNQKSKLADEEINLKPVENQLDVVSKLIKFLKD
ncbi:MAG: hypothetical protein CL609_21510 [Anaerolineaceae bacterium]|nr:hypothetical protein [Anaerolineaceae bacterium]